MAKDTKARLFEAYYRVKIAGRGNFKTEIDKFYFMRSVLKVLTTQNTYLDIVSTKFTKDTADIMLGSYVKYEESVVADLMNLVSQDCGYPLRAMVEKVANGRAKLGAFNATAPKMFLAIVSGRKEKLAFPDDCAKKFYATLLKKTIESMPLQVISYSVTTNAAYFCLMSLDQADVSVKTYLHTANEAYAKYYHENFAEVGNLFANKIFVKEISGREIFDIIAQVHAQPSIMGLAQGYIDYPFSSYTETPNTGLSQFDMLSVYIKLNNNQFITECADYSDINSLVINLYNYAHAHATNFRLDSYVQPDKDDFVLFYDQARAHYKAYDVDVISQETFSSIVIEINELGDYTFDEIFERITAPKKIKKALLADVMVEMAVKKLYTYDQILQRLGIEVNGDEVLCDMVLKINKDMGYSYDYIMAKLGLAYPNIGFLRNLIAKMADVRGFAKVTAIKELGLYDAGVIASL